MNPKSTKNGGPRCHFRTRDPDAAQISIFPQYHSFLGIYLVTTTSVIGDGKVSG